MKNNNKTIIVIIVMILIAALIYNQVKTNIVKSGSGAVVRFYDANGNVISTQQFDKDEVSKLFAIVESGSTFNAPPGAVGFDMTITIFNTSPEQVNFGYTGLYYAGSLVDPAKTFSIDPNQEYGWTTDIIPLV